MPTATETDERITEGREPLPAEVDVAIIGGGFSGLGAAIRLKQEGYEDFLVIEAGEHIGGTWHYNTYPGCACDVPSHLYSFSFAPNPEWSQTYSRQPEIRDYLRRCADRFGVRSKIRLGCRWTGAAWDEASGRWDLETDQGPLRARVLVSAVGPLFEPKLPDIPGIESFEGTIFHSARWDHDYDLEGKRVAAIGTGASAIQFVPAIAPETERLHVFQRTAPWIAPHTNRPVTKAERRLYRAFPALQRLVRGSIYCARELLVLGFVKRPRLMRIAERLARKHRESQISDPELLEKVTPGYPMGCKRILPSNDWYPALGQPDVELVTDGIAAVRGNAVVTADGQERQVDAIILGTGFQVTEMSAAEAIRGRDGRSLAEVWGGSPRAYNGTSVSGFPNLFFLLGPNTGLGHSSMIYMIESQIAYLLDALREMDAQGVGAVEVRPEVQAAYNSAIEDRMRGTVWSSGCSSWYLDATGRNASQWPDWTWRFRRRTARFRARDYSLRPAGIPAPVTAPA